MSNPTGILFSDPRVKPMSTAGQQQAGAYLLFYLTGTLTPANVYADGLLATPLSQTPGANQPSCTADSAGRFNPIYMNPLTTYRVQMYTAGNVLLEDTDPYVVPGAGSQPTQASIGALLYPQTTAEAAASVTPTNFAWPTLVPLRYGAVGDGITNDAPAVQTAFTVAGKAGGNVVFPPGYVFLCNSDISVPVAASFAGTVAGAIGCGWSTVSVKFGGAATFGFTFLGTGATTGGATGNTYNYAGTFRDLAIELNGTAAAFYVNSVNQPKVENCWIVGVGTTQGRGAYFLNCLLPVFEDCLVTGCGNATQYAVEFDSCTTASWRGSRISGSSGTTPIGGLAIDRCTNFNANGVSSESCGTPIVIGGKAESSLPCTGVKLSGLELENPGNGNPYVSIGAGLTASALVLNVKMDEVFGSPSGTTTIPYVVQMQNTSGFEASNFHTTSASGTSVFELTGTNITGVTIRPMRNLQSLAIPWVRYNGAQVLAAGPQMEWQLGLTQAIGGRPTCTSRGYAGAYTSTGNLTGATPSILISSSMGGYFSSVSMTQSGATTVTSLSGGEPGMEITIIPGDGNTTLTNGNSGGAFRLIGGSNLNLSAGKAYKFYNDGANGASGGSCWVQM